MTYSFHNDFFFLFTCSISRVLWSSRRTSLWNHGSYYPGRWRSNSWSTVTLDSQKFLIHEENVENNADFWNGRTEDGVYSSRAVFWRLLPPMENTEWLRRRLCYFREDSERVSLQTQRPGSNMRNTRNKEETFTLAFILPCHHPLKIWVAAI